MRGLIISCFALVLGIALTGCQEEKAASPAIIHHAAVPKDVALKRGVDFLLSTKRSGHWNSGENWPEAGDQFGGENGLTLVALLKTGQVTHDPRLQPDSPELGPGIAWEVHANTTTVYATALKVLVLCNATSTPDRAAILSHCTGLLIRAMNKDGGYGYNLSRMEKQTSDSSNSDYALMAVAEASRHGVQVPADYWVQAAHFWRTLQNPDGGWGYAPPELYPQSNPAMTAGGVVSLYNISTHMQDGDKIQHAAIGTAIAYLDHHFDLNSDYYDLYNMQRAGKMMQVGGERSVAIENELLSTQRPDGSWKSDFVSFWGQPNRTICTAYALLSLIHAEP